MNRIEKLKEFLNTSPNDNFLRHALALEYVKLGNDAAARALFESILQESPDYVGSYYHLGKLYERNGETDAALSVYEKGIAEAKRVNNRHAYSELQAAYDELAY